ncbi:hypothetical protein B0H19DRAFT_1124166 [Mycena capillaripes]|nr:hypothetical protein B0H19DRAFT_1124166 [Mycena capillaripes]
MSGARMKNLMKPNTSKAVSKNSGSAPPALEIQEICDYICDFLHESPADLRACSLVSPLFTSSAQHHLFHVIGVAALPQFSRLTPQTRWLCMHV